jgi:hypothetical protein
MLEPLRSAALALPRRVTKLLRYWHPILSARTRLTLSSKSSDCGTLESVFRSGAFSLRGVISSHRFLPRFVVATAGRCNLPPWGRP